LAAKDEKNQGGEMDIRLNDDHFGDENADEGPVDSEKVKEVDDRLNAFFSEDDDGTGPLKEEAAAPKPAGDRPADAKKTKPKTGTGISAMDVENSTLKELKSIILSLEWEISEEVMTRLVEEIASLEKKHKNDKIAVAFFQLMGALGKYIQKKQADAHPDSIGLINSVYESLEQAMASRNMSEGEKKKMLMVELDKYKQLKEQIKDAPKKKKAPPKPPPEPVRAEAVEADVEEGEPAPAASDADYGGYEDPDAPATNRDMLNVLIRIQQTLEREFRSLREELRSLRS
jgi:hypothetical protein